MTIPVCTMEEEYEHVPDKLPTIRTFVNTHGVQASGHGPILQLPNGDEIPLPSVTYVTGVVGPGDISKVKIEMFAVHVIEVVEP